MSEDLSKLSTDELINSLNNEKAATEKSNISTLDLIKQHSGKDTDTPISDLGNSIKSGLAGLAKIPLSLADMALNDKNDNDSLIRKGLKGLNDYQQEQRANMSIENQLYQQELGNAHGFGDALLTMAKSPLKTVGTVAEFAPSIGLGMFLASKAKNKKLAEGTQNILSKAAMPSVFGGLSGAETYSTNIVDPNVSKEDAMQGALVSGLGNAAATAVIGPLGEKANALKNPIAKTVGQIATPALGIGGMGAASQMGENVAKNEDITKDTGKAFMHGAAMGTFFGVGHVGVAKAKETLFSDKGLADQNANVTTEPFRPVEEPIVEQKAEPVLEPLRAVEEPVIQEQVKPVEQPLNPEKTVLDEVVKQDEVKPVVEEVNVIKDEVKPVEQVKEQVIEKEKDPFDDVFGDLLEQTKDVKSEDVVKDLAAKPMSMEAIQRLAEKEGLKDTGEIDSTYDTSNKRVLSEELNQEPKKKIDNKVYDSLDDVYKKLIDDGIVNFHETPESMFKVFDNKKGNKKSYAGFETLDQADKKINAFYHFDTKSIHVKASRGKEGVQKDINHEILHAVKDALKYSSKDKYDLLEKHLTQNIKPIADIMNKTFALGDKKQKGLEALDVLVKDSKLDKEDADLARRLIKSKMYDAESFVEEWVARKVEKYKLDKDVVKGLTPKENAQRNIFKRIYDAIVNLFKRNDGKTISHEQAQKIFNDLVKEYVSNKLQEKQVKQEKVEPIRKEKSLSENLDDNLIDRKELIRRISNKEDLNKLDEAGEHILEKITDPVLFDFAIKNGADINFKFKDEKLDYEYDLIIKISLKLPDNINSAVLENLIKNKKIITDYDFKKINSYQERIKIFKSYVSDKYKEDMYLTELVLKSGKFDFNEFVDIHSVKEAKLFEKYGYDFNKHNNSYWKFFVEHSLKGNEAHEALRSYVKSILEKDELSTLLNKTETKVEEAPKNKRTALSENFDEQSVRTPRSRLDFLNAIDKSGKAQDLIKYTADIVASNIGKVTKAVMPPVYQIAKNKAGVEAHSLMNRMAAYSQYNMGMIANRFNKLFPNPASLSQNASEALVRFGLNSKIAEKYLHKDILSARERKQLSDLVNTLEEGGTKNRNLTYNEAKNVVPDMTEKVWKAYEQKKELTKVLVEMSAVDQLSRMITRIDDKIDITRLQKENGDFKVDEIKNLFVETNEKFLQKELDAINEKHDKKINDLATELDAELNSKSARPDRIQDLKHNLEEAKKLKEQLIQEAKEDSNLKIDQMNQIIDDMNTSISNNYMPLDRFGDYGVYYKASAKQTARDPELFYARKQFESEADAKRFLRNLKPHERLSADELKKLNLSTDGLFTISSQEFLPQYMSMHAFEKLTEALDSKNMDNLDIIRMKREAIKMTDKADVMKFRKMLNREAIEGFSEDPIRVMAKWATNSSHSLANSVFTERINGELKRLKEDPANGEIHEYMREVFDHMLKGDTSVGAMPAKKLKAFMSVYFLSTPFSAALNLTSNILNTPALILNLTKSEKQTATIMTQAFKEASKAINLKTMEIDISKVKDDRIAFYLKTAQKEGKLAPAETISLAIAAENGNPAMMALGRGFMGMFAKTEMFNRAVAAIAGGLAHDYAKLDMNQLTNTYKERGLKFSDRADADFINHVVDSTQMIMNMANVAPIARTSIGSTLYTFKSYSMGTLALMKSLPWKERMVMLGTLSLMSGLGGLPFSEDLTDLVETVAGYLGHPVQIKREARKMAEEAFGKDLAYVIEYGIAGKAIGQHVGPRMGLQNVIPATKSLDRFNPNALQDGIGELAGPAYGLARNYATGIKKISEGNMAGLIDMSPSMIGNIAKAAEAAKKGYFVDSKGNKTSDATSMQIFMKALGANSVEAGLISQVRGDIKRVDQITQTMSASFARGLALARNDRDIEKVKSIIENIKAYNANVSPELKIDISKIQKSSARIQKELNMDVEKIAVKGLAKDKRSAFSREIKENKDDNED